MIYKNQSGQKIGCFAYTASTGAAKTGDAAQITCYESIGFAAADQLDDANPTELDATNMPGWYVFDLTQAETNGEVLIFAPKSSTSGVVLDQIQVVTEASLPQTGDSYARLGAPAGASVSADIAAIEAQTDDIGIAGAGLTAVPWNAAWDAEVQSEATDALNAYDPPTNAELEARTLVAANYFDPAADTVAHVTLVDTTTTNTDMVAAAPTVNDIAAAILVTPANLLDTDANGYVSISGTKNTLDSLADFDPATDVVAHVTLVDTTTTNSDMVAAAPSAADIKTALEADGSKLDHLWEMTEDDGGVRRLTANALEEAPVDGAAPTVGDIADAVWDEALAGHAGAGTAGAALSAATAPTAADVADAVWDEAIAGHADAGSTGAALSAAGAAGDPWITALPGAYAAGSAGGIIGNLVDDIGALTPAVAISATTAASVSTGALAVRTYHSLSQAISSTYAGNLNAATKLWLAIKSEKDDTDAQAVIFIEKTAGLTVLAGAAYTTVAHGSLTVGGLAGAWTVTVALDEVATGLLTAYADGMLWAECKALVAGSTVAVWDGVCDVSRGIVNAVT